MRTAVRGAAATATLAALAFVAADTCSAQDVIAYNEGRPDIDYEAFWAGVPQLKALGNDALEEARNLNELMEQLAAHEADPAAGKEIRGKVREALLRYRDLKAKEVRIADLVLKSKPTSEKDLAIVKRLRETELIGISWNKAKFVDCLRDLSQALNVRFVLHPDVLKFNTVEVTFPRTAADGILRALCTGFGCDYIVHNGEIVVIKSIKRNDERLQEYLDRHPDWKYWRPDVYKEAEKDDL
jgi:hypothetical protein